VAVRYKKKKKKKKEEEKEEKEEMTKKLACRSRDSGTDRSGHAL
jgi:hypothetical protein